MDRVRSRVVEQTLQDTNSDGTADELSVADPNELLRALHKLPQHLRAEFLKTLRGQAEE
jgi:hypothetical protein